MGLIGYLLGRAGRAWLATGSQASQAKFIACKRVRFGNLIQPGSRETVFGFLVAHRFEIEDACRARGGAPSEPGSGETRNFAASWEPGSGSLLYATGQAQYLNQATSQFKIAPQDTIGSCTQLIRPYMPYVHS